MPRRTITPSKFGTSVRRNPLFDKYQTVIPYDGMTPDDVKSLSPQQKTDEFFSRWMANADPFVRYESYLKSGRESQAIVLSKAKRLYKSMVLSRGWDELKYVMVLDYMFTANIVFSIKACEECGNLYDREELPFQRQDKRMKRKRI